MAAQFPIDVTARDKTQATMDALTRRWEKWNKTAEKSVKPVQLIEKSLDRILKPFGFERFAGNFAKFGDAAGGLSSGLGGLAGEVGGLGEMAAAAAGPITLIVAATGAAGASVAAAANKYNEAGASLEYFSHTLGMSVADIQKWQGAADQMQVSAEETKATLLGVRDALAKPWEHPLAQSVLRAKGFVPPAPGEKFDENAWLMRIAGIIHQQTDPAVKSQIAKAFGIPDQMIPLLDQDPKVLKRTLDAQAKNNPYTSGQTAAAAKRDQDVREAGHALGGLTRSLTSFASDAVAPVAHPAAAALRKATQAVEGVRRNGVALPTALLGMLMGPIFAPAMLAGVGFGGAGADKLRRSAAAARVGPGGVKLDIRGAMAKLNAARAGVIGDAAFNRFAARIEKQESGGHQFRRRGRPLVSSAGAVGAMQLMPSTAASTARQHGIAYDPARVALDKTYNELIGRLHLQDLLKKYSGSQTLAAAAYNAGEAIIDDWLGGLNRSGKNPLRRHLADPRLGPAQDAAFRAGIPGRGPGTYAQTRDYVAATAPVEVTVKFVNAPAGTVAQAKGPPGTKIQLHVGRAMQGAG